LGAEIVWDCRRPGKVPRNEELLDPKADVTRARCGDIVRTVLERVGMPPGRCDIAVTVSLPMLELVVVR
jgi:hypothetical protein